MPCTICHTTGRTTSATRRPAQASDQWRVLSIPLGVLIEVTIGVPIEGPIRPAPPARRESSGQGPGKGSAGVPDFLPTSQ